MNKSIFLILLFISILSCTKEDTAPIPLKAIATYNGTAKPLEEITLDGSASTGPEGFTYKWTYSGDVPEDEINLENSDFAIATFTPPSDNIYTFTLTVTSGSSFDSDMVTISTTGAAEIGGTLTENLVLRNIQPDAYLPDYIVTSDLIIGDNIEVSVVDEDVRIEFRSGTGIHIKSGGKFTNRSSQAGMGYDLKLYGEDGWKGIFVENGRIFLNDATISDAGTTAFTGMDDAGALVFFGSETHIEYFQRNTFENSRSYDILSPAKISNNGVVTRNTLSYKHPMKVHVSFLGFFSFDHPNYFPDNQLYSVIIPSGSGILDQVPKGYMLFEEGGNYYVDGDLYAGSLIYNAGNSTIYMKEGAAILTEKKLLLSSFEATPIVFEGLDGAQWKGIASKSTAITNAFEIYGITIKDAGYGIISIGEFTAEAPAALYSAATSGFINDLEIVNSGGFGYYNERADQVSTLFRNCHFKNTTQAAIRINAMSVGHTLPSLHDCTFDLADNVPAVLVQGDGAPTYSYPWNSLGGENFYLVDANILEDYGFAINPGVTIKFKAGRSLVFTDPNSNFSARGVVNHPIILEGEMDTPGSWGGLYLGNRFTLSRAIVRNGGEFILPNATEKANIISAVPTSSTNPIQVIENTTISGSDGYGIVVEQNTLDFDFDNIENYNTFSNNSSGDVLRK